MLKIDLCVGVGRLVRRFFVLVAFLELPVFASLDHSQH